MHVRLRLFAMLREQAGWRERELELGAEATVADAWREVTSLVPALARYGEVVRFARNGQYAGPDERLGEGDQLAVIPPVAGGADEPRAADDAPAADDARAADDEPAADDARPADAADDRLLRCELTAEPIADELLAELRRTVPTPADGALVIFVGQTRETPGPPAPGEEESAARHAGERVSGLDYEAFDEMALGVLRDIGAEIEQRFGVRRLALIHRTGHVELAQPSVVICAAAPHRAAAFDACRYAIEELKARAPIWKRERYAGGGVWVGEPARDR